MYDSNVVRQCQGQLEKRQNLHKKVTFKDTDSIFWSLNFYVFSIFCM